MLGKATHPQTDQHGTAGGVQGEGNLVILDIAIEEKSRQHDASKHAGSSYKGMSERIQGIQISIIINTPPWYPMAIVRSVISRRFMY